MNPRSVSRKGTTVPINSFVGSLIKRRRKELEKANYTLCVPGRHAPTWYKATFVNWLAAFPVITMVQLAFKPMLHLLPFLLQMLISTGVVAVVLTVLVMPWMNRIFMRWLKTPPASQAPNTPVQ